MNANTTIEINNKGRGIIMKTEIKKFLGLKRWSIRCDRVADYLRRHPDVEIDDLYIHESSDFWWASRQNRIEKDIENIGAESYGRHSFSYIYIYH